MGANDWYGPIAPTVSIALTFGHPTSTDRIVAYGWDWLMRIQGKASSVMPLG